MPRNRQPLGSSETVQDMPLPAIREQIESLINWVVGKVILGSHGEKYAASIRHPFGVRHAKKGALICPKLPCYLYLI